MSESIEIFDDDFTVSFNSIMLSAFESVLPEAECVGTWILLLQRINHAEWHVSNSVKWMLVCFTDFLHLLWNFLSPLCRGYGRHRNYVFSLWMVQISHSPLLKFWVFSYAVLQACVSEQCCVSGVRKSCCVIFPLQDNLERWEDHESV